MKIAFLVNRVETEDPGYSTTRLAHAALGRGHEVLYLGCEDLVFDPSDRVMALAVRPPAETYDSDPAFLAALQEAHRKGDRERADLGELDVLLLRNDPSEDQVLRPWAQAVGILFGNALVERGVLVLNDPTGLSRALNKMYLQHFPEDVRPSTLITRDPEEIKAFVKERARGKVVLKPLQGSGGQSVFLVAEDEAANLNQIIDAVQRFGYVVAQEYLPAAAEGDTRLFLMNGRPLVADGKYCAFRRIAAEGDLRANLTAGGHAAPAEVTERMLEIAETVRPRLVQDGMFLVGLDIAGDRILEINVFSPGGLGSASHFEGVDFMERVLEAIEAKQEHKERSMGRVSNGELAVL